MRPHRNVQTRCTHEERRYCIMKREKRRCQPKCTKSRFQLMAGPRVCEGGVRSFRVLYAHTHAGPGGRTADTGTPLQQSEAERWKNGHNCCNAKLLAPTSTGGDFRGPTSDIQVMFPSDALRRLRLTSIDSSLVFTFTPSSPTPVKPRRLPKSTVNLYHNAKSLAAICFFTIQDR